VSRSGELKLSDFGLATVYVGPTKSYSHQVATRWYRAPELLLGGRQYDGAVDMWAVGAVLAELLHLVPLFPGQSDIDQLFRIFQVLGHPEASWPEVTQLPDASKVEFPPYRALPWSRVFPDASPDALDLLSKLLVLDPTQRLSAREALTHPFFFSGAVAPRVPEERVYSTVQRSASQHNRDATHGDTFLNSLGKPLRPPCA
jgi:serine/threonine protein kinase